MQTFENVLLQTTQKDSLILHTNSPWLCVIKVCSNGGATQPLVGIIYVCSRCYNNNVKL